MTTPIISLRNLTKEFAVKRQVVRAVDDVTLDIAPGEVVCLVGESGCGKTTTGKMVAGLLAPTSGSISFKGTDIRELKGDAWKQFRLGVQLIHQDPYASLNSSQTIYQILSAPLLRHGLVRGEAAARARTIELLELVNLTPAADLIVKYPHQLSGGQRQRVSIARALTVNPSFLVADEAVASVDMSIRISLLNTLTALKQKMGLGVLFITHDLALAKFFAWEGRIGVMYLGRMVELAPARELIDHPQHPYTKALLSAIPEPDLEGVARRERILLRSEDIPSLLKLPPGCAFHPRCPAFEGDLCTAKIPVLTHFRDGTAVACHPVAVEKLQMERGQS